NPSAPAAQGWILLARGESSGALVLADQLINRDEWVGYLLRSDALAEQGNWEDSLAAAETALRLRPNNDQALWRVTRALQESGQYTAAIRSYGEWQNPSGYRFIVF